MRPTQLVRKNNHNKTQTPRNSWSQTCRAQHAERNLNPDRKTNRGHSRFLGFNRTVVAADATRAAAWQQTVDGIFIISQTETDLWNNMSPCTGDTMNLKFKIWYDRYFYFMITVTPPADLCVVVFKDAAVTVVAELNWHSQTVTTCILGWIMVALWHKRV